jgi:hypothetical protein
MTKIISFVALLASLFAVFMVTNIEIPGVPEIPSIRDMLSGTTNFDSISLSNDLTVADNVEIGGTLVEGGGLLSKTGTTTLTASEVCNYSVVSLDPQQATGITLTLPATSTLFADCLDANGERKTLLVENAADGSEVVTIVAGTGGDLQEPDGQNVVIGQNNFAWIDLVRINANEVAVLVNETIPAD